MIVDILRQSTLFDGIPPDELEQLMIGVGQRFLAAGELLFQKGEEGNECYVTLSGALDVISYAGGEEVLLMTIPPGQIVGEMALIDRSPRSATVRAAEDSCLAVLTEEYFHKLIQSKPQIALELLRGGTARLRATSQQLITDLERKNAELLRAYEELQSAQDERIRLNRIEEELAVARRIQELFLPRTLPQLSGWEIAAFNRGAQAVGGDFFDCIELPGGQLGLIVADVCGKGVPAALFVALTRSLLRAASQAPWAFREYTLEPDVILAGALWLTNDYIAREHGASNMFITLFYGVLEPQTGEFHYVNAGHNPPLLISPDGTNIRELDCADLPIGIVESQVYETSQVVIEPGELLIGFSDGITEALDPSGEPYGDHRLQQALQEYAGVSASTLIQKLAASVEAFANGAPQADDMTLLVIRRVEEKG